MMTEAFPWSLDFCRDTSDVPRRETAPSHLITHMLFLRAQSLRGHMGRSILPVIDKPQPFRSPARPMAGRQVSGCARFASIRPKIVFTTSGADTAAGRCFNHPVYYPSD